MAAKIAFLGTGLMGFPMARNLAQSGHSVTAWNRSPDKAQGLTAHGCSIAPSAIEAVSNADIVVSMVFDGNALSALVDQLAQILTPGTIWVDMSSTKASDAHRAAHALTSFGVGFVDAPVSGGTKGAEAATLAIMAGGEQRHFAKIEPILAVLGTPVHVGPTGSGQLCKLANQAIVGVTIGVVAEAQLFLERGGVDTDAMRQALRGGFADSTILQQHGSRMARRDFEPGAHSSVQLKDLRNIRQQAQTQGLHLPLVEALEERFERYVDRLDGAARDHSGLFEELLDLNTTDVTDGVGPKG